MSGGRELDVEGVPEAGGAAIVVAVPPDLGEGSQLLVWRVNSIDGHAVGGTLGFAVGTVTETVAAPQEQTTAAPAIIARFFVIAALAFGVGGVVFARLVDVEARAPAWTRRLARGAILAILPATVAAVATQGLDLLVAPFSALLGPEPWQAVLSGRGGPAAALAVAAGLLTLGSGKAVAFAAWAAASLSFAIAGHAATASPAALMAPAVALHATALIFWLGALPPLAGTAAAGGPGLAPLLRRFSSLAVPLVAVLVISGTVLAVVQLGWRPAALLDTAYGRLLAIKLVLVAAMLALAAWNRWRLTPMVAEGHPAATRHLARSAATETLLAVAILALVAGFRATPPPRAMVAPVAEVAMDGAALTLSPGRVGLNDVAISFPDAPGPESVRVAFAMPDRGIEPIRAVAEPGADGVWRAGPVHLPLAGTWEVTLRVAATVFESTAIRGSVTLPP